MFGTRAWRGSAVVDGDGIEPPTSTDLANMTQAVEDFWFWHETDQSARSDNVRSSGVEPTLREWLSTSEFGPTAEVGWPDFLKHAPATA